MDTHADPDVDPVPDPTVDVPGDDPVADTVVTDTVTDPDTEEMDVLDATCPPESVLGTPCAVHEDCTGGTCLVERNQGYDGETYRMWVGGYCADSTWATGCDPADASGCGPGARCVHLGTLVCEDRWACMDACAYADSSGVPYPFNACCRSGYRCDPLWQVCVPGCSNDRECCESWTDADGDTQRDAGEVVLDGTCSQACSPDTWACGGSGGDDWSVECTLDAHCPPGGTCLAESCSSPLGQSFPGGICLGFGCTEDPSACTAAGGGCTPDPADATVGAVCLAGCHTGATPGDPASECRDGYGCMPVCSSGWVGTAPASGADGYCWPARGTGATEDTVYAPCTGDDGCASPLGLGVCERAAGASYCSSVCNASLAMDQASCGSPSAAGEVAPGVCWQCRCRMSCEDTEGPLADGPCDGASMLACYPLSDLFGEKTWASEASEPAGLCLPACATPLDCESLWGIAYDCDAVSGRCEL